MEVMTFIVEEQEAGLRIDHYLTEALEGYTRSYIQKLFKKEAVLILPDKVIKKNYVLRTDDQIELQLPDPEVWAIEAEDLPLEIVYQDEDLVVINKAQGVVVHPAPGNYTGTLVNALMYHIKDLSDIGGVIRPGIVHRIDKDTSGLLMVAKNNHAHKCLSDQLKEHTVDRMYYAIVHGGFSSQEGTVNAPLGRHPKNRLKMSILPHGGKEAITHYTLIERLGPYSLIKCQLETGRTHQIRVHMASIGHPLVGDPLYGVKKEKFNVTGQCLHAATLGFDHPRTGEHMVFEAPLPTTFLNMLDKMR